MKKFICIVISLVLTFAMSSVLAWAEDSVEEAVDGGSIKTADGSGYMSERLEFSILADNTARIEKILGDSSELVIPSVINGHTVTQLAIGSISDRYDGIIGKDYDKTVKTIVFPDTISYLEGNPISLEVRSASYRVAPDHPYLATIDKALFSKPDKRIISHPYVGFSVYDRVEYSIPDGIEVIGYNAFGYSGSMRLSLPKSVKRIEGGSFDDDLRISNLSDSSVEYIGSYTFSHCAIDGLPKNLTRIEDYLFYYNRSLSHVEIPESVTYIGDDAFFHCEALIEIVIPESVAYVGKYAFDGCRKLQTLNIPKSVTSLGGPICNPIRDLSITVDKDNPKYTVLDGFLIARDDMKLIQPVKYQDSYQIPNGIKSIESGAFSSYTGEIHIPASVVEIGSLSSKASYVVESGTYGEKYVQEKGYQYVYASSSNDWLYN